MNSFLSLTDTNHVSARQKGHGQSFEGVGLGGERTGAFSHNMLEATSYVTWTVNYRTRPGRPGSHAKGSSPAHAQWLISGGHLLFTREILVANHTPLSLVSPTPGIVWVAYPGLINPDSAIIPILCHMIYERKGEGYSGAGSSEITPANSPWSHGTAYLPQESGKGHIG